MARSIKIQRSADWVMILIYLLLVIAGWLSIYGASYDFDSPGILDFSQRYSKQLLWMVLAFGFAIILLYTDTRFYKNMSYVFYGLSILVLLVTLVVAPDIKGSRSWLVLGPVSLQPAEFAKFSTALALAFYMSRHNYKLKNLKDMFVSAAIVALPALIVLMQNETGSALVFSAFFLVFYREGMKGIFLFLGVCAVVFFIVTIQFSVIPISDLHSLGELMVAILIVITQIGMLLVFVRDWTAVKHLLIGNVLLFAIAVALNMFNIYPVDLMYAAYLSLAVSVVYLVYLSFKNQVLSYALIAVFAVFSMAYSYSADLIFEKMQPHQQMRIKVLLGMEDDLQGAGYNVNQSKIAIGSGGVLGKGFLNGTQTKLKYVPEQDTDFIFCTVGEEHGFVGSVVVLALFLALIARIIYLSELQKSKFSLIYGYSLASILLFHFTINIGMVLGVMPVIGIPLPFFSYGGSSLWGFTILLFIFIALDRSRMERL
jgi:rod shape determining protein RodA